MKFSKILLLLFILTLTVFVINIKALQRLHRVIHFFDEDVIVENFQNTEKYFPVSELIKSSSPLRLAKVDNIALPDSFVYKMEFNYLNLQDFLKNTNTEGFMIIHNDTIKYENYWLGLEADETHVSWSMSKSLISTLIGVMVDRGFIDLKHKVEFYCPEFVGSGYEGVSIKQLLNMSSGVKFTEDYGDFNSDINRFGRAFALGSSFLEFSKSLNSERIPGTYNKYVSIDTQVLGFVLSQVSGKSITALTQEYIWEPVGMEYGGSWIIDNEGFEMVLGGLNATLRDFSKLGLLFLHEGALKENRIVSSKWVADATTPDAPHLMPDQVTLSNNPYGYAYQWWLPQFPKNDFFAVGIYDQFVYVNKEKQLIIAKLSADYRFKTNGKEIKDQHIYMLQQIAEAF